MGCEVTNSIFRRIWEVLQSGGARQDCLGVTQVGCGVLGPIDLIRLRGGLARDSVLRGEREVLSCLSGRAPRC